MTPTPSSQPFNSFVRIANTQRAKLMIGFAASFAETAVMLAIPWFAGQFAAGLFGPSTAWNPSSVLILLAVLFAVQALSRFCALRGAGSVWLSAAIKRVRR